MSSTSRRASGPVADPEAVLAGAAIVIVLLAVGVIVAATHLAVWVDGSHQRLAGNPVTLIGDLVRGRERCPAQTVPIAAGIGAVLMAVAGVVAWAMRGFWRANVDRAARWTGQGKEIGRLSSRAATRVASRLEVQTPGAADRAGGPRRSDAVGGVGGRRRGRVGPTDGEDDQPGDPVDPRRARRGAGEEQQA